MLKLQDPMVTDPMDFLVYPLSHLNMIFAMQPAGMATSADTGTASAAMP